MITSRWKISNLPQNQIKCKIVKCPKSQSQQMPKHMVHPQGNGIAQNTKYEEMTKKTYGIYISSKFAQTQKVVIIPKLKKS